MTTAFYAGLWINAREVPARSGGTFGASQGFGYPIITSVLVGASRPAQIDDDIGVPQNLTFDVL